MAIVQTPTNSSSFNSSIAASNSVEVVDPLDQLSSASIAVNVAKMTGLPETTAVINRADTVAVQTSLVSSSDSVVAKPQVISASIKSRHDIFTYKVLPGDTVSKLASKFNVTSDSIRLSNDIIGEEIAPGTYIRVLEGVNGIIYKVASGDTAASLAARFQASKDEIIAYNDAEAGLPIGQYVIIPGGLLIAQQTFAPAPSQSYQGGFAWGNGSAVYGSNGYDFGWCTWYVASKISVPNNWGNANTWDDGARATPGWRVGSTPSVGAIGQNDWPGIGHVAVVDEVSPDGSKIKYSDMNGLAGWGSVGRSGWVSASYFQSYLSR